MAKKLLGLVFLMCGIGVFVCTVAVEIAWLGLCFGTVIVGILMLLFAPALLLMPINIGFVTGMAIWAAGLALISSDYDSGTQKLEKFRSTEKKKVDPRVIHFLQPQIEQIESFGGRLPIDHISVAYVSAVIKVITKKNLSLAQLKPLVHGIFGHSDRQVALAFEYALDNHSAFFELIRDLTPVVRDELALGNGSFLVKYTSKMSKTGDKVLTFGANYVDSTPS